MQMRIGDGGRVMAHNTVWREIHRSPTRLGHRLWECRYCTALKTTKRNIPKSCEFCHAEE